jgi:hypothetical protein
MLTRRALSTTPVSFQFLLSRGSVEGRICSPSPPFERWNSKVKLP